jgi:NTP pyrophosphatase (non-canonical NTP hydrolase)
MGVPQIANEILRRAGGILVALRRNCHEDIKHCCADVMAWTFSLCAAAEISLNGVLAIKFPGRCTYCGGKPCECGPNKQTAQSFSYNEQHSLSGWQSLLNEIYGEANDHKKFWYLGFKLAEEASEVETACHPLENSRPDFEGEVADLVSWLLAIATFGNFDLEQVVLDRYPNFNCCRCGTSPCVCSATQIAPYR